MAARVMEESRSGKSRSEEKTELISMSRSRLFATLVMLYGWLWILLLSVAVVATLALGVFVDLRWAVIALMLLFIIGPLLTAYLYFYHGLKPLTAINAVPHTLTISDTGISVVIPVPSHSSGEEEGTSDARKEEATAPETRHLDLPYSTFINFLTSSSGYLLMARDRRKGFLRVPYSTFDNEEETERFLLMIRKNRPLPSSQ